MWLIGTLISANLQGRIPNSKGVFYDGERNWGLPEHKIQVDAHKIRVDPTAGAHRPHADLCRDD
jgi:hypothetical protein